MEPVKWLTPDEAAELYNIKAGTIRKWLRQGKLPGYQVGDKLWRIDAEDMDNFVKGKHQIVQSDCAYTALSKEAQQRRADNLPSALVVNVACLKCGHMYLTDMIAMLKEAAEGNTPQCPECGADVLGHKKAADLSWNWKRE